MLKIGDYSPYAAIYDELVKDEEEQPSLAIDYQVASAMELPFADAIFDFATGFMSFMDIPETDRVLAEAYRVLKPDGFLQFSITHPSSCNSGRESLEPWIGAFQAVSKRPVSTKVPAPGRGAPPGSDPGRRAFARWL